MSDYGDRMLKMEVESKESVVVDETTVESSNQNENEVFIKTEVVDKKQKLKDHLAKCREKSAIVRKAKKEEKERNKVQKPRGRPKKVNVLDDVVEEEDVLSGNPSTPNDFQEIPKQIPKEIPKSDVIAPKQINNGIDMDLLLNKLDDRINTRFNTLQDSLKPKSDSPKSDYIAPKQNPQDDLLKMMNDREQMIRNDERSKYKKEQEQSKLETLQKSTKKYFGRLPPTDLFAPQPQNEWDNLFQTRKKNLW
jgi:hypothetical protein